MVSKDDYLNNIIKISQGDIINRENLIEKLEKNEYSRESVVYKTGDYAVRGFIIDIFPMLSENPIRLEFFGDEIDSIREFDASTQKSIRSISDVIIYPNVESYFKNEIAEISNKASSIMDYIGKKYTFIIKDYNQIKVANNKQIIEVTIPTNKFTCIVVIV